MLKTANNEDENEDGDRSPDYVRQNTGEAEMEFNKKIGDKKFALLRLQTQMCRQVTSFTVITSLSVMDF